MGLVYLLHLNKPYRHAKHYIGYVEKEKDLQKRLDRHRSGKGARLLQVVLAAGIDFEVSRIWHDKDRAFERSQKQRGHSRKCPICKSKQQ